MFFGTFGALPNFLTLEASAIIGRAVGLLLFAIAWTSLGRRLTGSRTSAALALSLFCLYALAVYRVPWLSLSGEWVVGGIEGKLPAWAFALFAIRWAIDRRWLAFGATVGLATSFHPVVGAWTAICVVIAECFSSLRGDPPWRHGFRTLAAGAGISFLLAAPGLLGAISFLQRETAVPDHLAGEVRDVSHLQARGDYVQVFGRLKHHLDPMEFSTKTWILYGGFVVAWLGFLAIRSRRKNGDGRNQDDAAHRVHLILGSAIFIAIVALLVGYGPRPAMRMTGFEWRAKLLKLYPFRIADTFLPMVLCCQIAALLVGKDGIRQKGGLVAAALVGGIVIAASAASGMQSATDRRVDWLEACDWIQANTPATTVCVTPRESADFKWFAERAEFVNYKDCPQDSSGIVEWNWRLFAMRSWRQKSIADDDAYSDEDLRNLAELSGASYLVTSRIGPILPEPIYSNRTYRIYKLR